MSMNGIAALLGSVALLVGSVVWAQPPAPVIEPAKGGQCVGDPAFMRRNHMDLLKHQRNDTLRGGDRTGKHSLKSCIDCHASKTSHSVAAEPSNFCQSCHAYAAVKIDCFECHASKPQVNLQVKP
ncbi:MAG: hypothetical protein RIR79_351 [Pseudomonadota bacterium]